MVKYTPGGARNFLVPSRMHAGQVLRARREPAALQAALHGGRVRPVLPDREVLPRRGPAPRPAARVHADRRRDVVREPGRRLPRHGRARLHASGRRCSAIDLTTLYPSGALPADAVRGVDGQVRQRQARPALRPAARRPHRPRHRARRRRRPVLEGHRRQVHERRVPARPAGRDRQGAAHPGEPRASCRARSSTSSRTSSRAWAPRASRARRSTPRATGRSRRSRRRSRRSCARRSTRASARRTATSCSSSSGARASCRR